MPPFEILKNGAAELGQRISEPAARKFRQYADELLRWNRAYNLTAITDPREIVIKHFLDSLLFLKAFPEGNNIRVFDLGTGAGFPGLPLKIVRPDLNCVLVEPSRKKCSFLRHMIRLLELDGIEIRQDRVEGVQDLETADVVVSRALFKIGVLQRLLRERVRPGTRVILSKGPTVEDEVREADYPAEIRKIRLPFHDVDRWLIIWIT